MVANSFLGFRALVTSFNCFLKCFIIFLNLLQVLLIFFNFFSAKFSSGLVLAGDGGASTSFSGMVVPVPRLSIMMFPSCTLKFIYELMCQLGEILFPSGVRGTVSMLSFRSKGMVSPDWFSDSTTPYSYSSLFTPSLSGGDKALKAYNSSWWGNMLVQPELLAVAD